MEQEKLERVQQEVNQVIQGKSDVVRKVFAAMLAGGHILMEDIPGVGKTTLATTFAKTLDLRYHRVQFTPDVLPSDILGFSMYQNKTGEFEFHPGSIFCNLFLADEINRTSPKTQSALLEVMEERQASVEGKTWALPGSVFRIATQKSERLLGNTVSAGVPAGSFYDLSFYGISVSSGRRVDLKRRGMEAGAGTQTGAYGRGIKAAPERNRADLCS